MLLLKTFWIDVKLSEAQLSEIIQSSGFLVNKLGNLTKNALIGVVIPFSKNALPKLVSNIASNAASNAISKFERNISGKRQFYHLQHIFNRI